MFAGQLWQIEGGDARALARQARVLGLGFLAVKCAYGDVPYVLSPTVDHLSRSAHALHALGLAVWGWGVVTGNRPELEAAVAIEQVRRADLAGWIIEPLNACPARAVVTYETVLRLGLGDLPLAVMADDGLDGTVVGAIADDVQAVMPRVTTAGGSGLAAASLASCGRPLVPVLDLRAGLTAGRLGIEAVESFMAANRDSGRLGAALLAWDTCLHTTAGHDVLRAFSRFDWPPSRNEGQVQPAQKPSSRPRPDRPQ